MPKRQTTSDRKKIIAQAKKAQTSMGNVIRMLEEDVYCINVLQQALAVSGLWRGVIENIFGDHLRSCFLNKLKKAPKAEQVKAIEEVIRILNLSKRS